jgi:hypothetical protein
MDARIIGIRVSLIGSTVVIYKNINEAVDIDDSTKLLANVATKEANHYPYT